ncbi:MAG: Asp-tRNA(Asn)/Glu-tRNA(Gln) amidotransferase subunit GatC [Candidatus Azambacteria bacterium]|nr:Asp-tRNA(Asn)/Glu-tRNA(Gln) amidotransferase subunit GatC [Candidatus Azambacteria bacterium]
MDKKTVQHIAKLSYLHVDEDELTTIANELSSILAYVSELNTVDTEDTEAMGRAAAHTNVFRKDETHPADLECVAALVNAAPDTSEGYIKVKAIL